MVIGFLLFPPLTRFSYLSFRKIESALKDIFVIYFLIDKISLTKDLLCSFFFYNAIPLRCNAVQHPDEKFLLAHSVFHNVFISEPTFKYTFSLWDWKSIIQSFVTGTLRRRRLSVSHVAF